MSKLEIVTFRDLSVAVYDTCRLVITHVSLSYFTIDDKGKMTN